MKALIVYWSIGAILLGSGMGSRLKDCPLDDLSLDTNDLIFVATWPLVVGAVFALPTGWKAPQRPCRNSVSE